MRYKICIVIALSSAFLGQLSAQDVEKYGIQDTVPPSGIQVGELAPDFKAVSQKGGAVQLSTELKEGPVVLIFYRGAWCPFCVKYLLNVSDSLDYIENKGASVFAVTPQLIEGIKIASEKTDGKIAILHDKNGNIMNAYDGSFEVTEKYQKRVNNKKLNLAESNGQSIAKLPVPATYVIGSDGLILYRQFDYNYKKRATVRAILDALD